MKKHIRIRLFCITSSILYLNPGFAQNHTTGNLPEEPAKSITFHFHLNSSVLETEYSFNAQAFDELSKIMSVPEAHCIIDSVIIKSSSSPEGPIENNIYLSNERGLSIKNYLILKYPALNPGKIKIFSIGENWDGLRKIVEDNPSVPYRDDLLKIIEMNITPREKDILIKKIGNGTAFAFFSSRIYPYLRSANCIITYQKASENTRPLTGEESVTATPPGESAEDIPEQETPLPATETADEPKDGAGYKFVRPIAFKTNLLFDLASALNAEIEIPAGKRFSVAGEIIFPWWLWERKQHCLEILAGTAEVRYWFKPDYNKQDPSLKRHNPLTGWFAGVYASAGKYDLEWDKKGYQGEVSISAGVSVGYVKPLSRNLSMEFSVGAGYMQTNYRHYEAKQDVEGEWHLIKQYSGIYKRLGPTKAKISLIWYPHFKSSKKEGVGK